MKQHLGKLQIAGAAKMKSRFHTRGLSAVASLRIPMLALACAAVAGSFTNSTNASTLPAAEDLFAVSAANLSTNIVLKGSDPNGLPLTFSVLTFPLHGFLSGTAPNLVYTATGDFVGLDGFNYVVSNGQATSTPATVNIIVKHGLSINNISITEGNSGTKAATFTITMTGRGCATTAAGCGPDTVFVTVMTKDGTARAGSDYFATLLTALPLAPNVTSQLFSVGVIGDTAVEFNESFVVQLTNPSFNAIILNGTGRCTILDDDTSRILIGTAALDPEVSVVGAEERVNLSLAWTHPVGWRQLDSVDLLILDDQGPILDTRWHEAENSFSLFDPAADRFVRTAQAGSPARFETSGATMYLQQCTGGGPPGKTATIDFNLSFKREAAGRTFSVEASATDDAGNQQGFESVGTITVLLR